MAHDDDGYPHITISIISIMMTTSRTIEPILRITTDRPSQPVSGHLA